jgi:hypothetical protein
MSETTVAEQATPRAGKRSRMPTGVQGTQQPDQAATDGPAAEDGSAATQSSQTAGEPDGQEAIDQAQAHAAERERRSGEERRAREAEKAKAPAKPAYVTDEGVIEELAEGIAAARKAGLGRSALQKASGITGKNTVWRAEMARKILPEEVAPLRALLAKIESGDVSPPERRAAGPKQATRADLAAKLDAVAQLLHAEWGAVKPASFRDALADIVGAAKPEETK